MHHKHGPRGAAAKAPEPENPWCLLLGCRAVRAVANCADLTEQDRIPSMGVCHLYPLTQRGLQCAHSLRDVFQLFLQWYC